MNENTQLGFKNYKLSHFFVNVLQFWYFNTHILIYMYYPYLI